MQLINNADIATAAYHIWLNEGCPEGRDQQHWLRACEVLTATPDAVAAPAAAPKTKRAAKPKAATPTTAKAKSATPTKAAAPAKRAKVTASAKPAKAADSVTTTTAKPRRKAAAKPRNAATR